MNYTHIMRMIIFAALLLTVNAISAKSRYCLTYEDYLANRWTNISTVSVFSQNVNKHDWLDGSIYRLSTGAPATDKILKKKAFAVMKDSLLLINVHNLRCEGNSFGNGYTEAERIGQRKILITGIPNNGKAHAKQDEAQFWGGIIARAVVASNQRKHPVCYIISKKANNKGRIEVKIVDDREMNHFLLNHEDLLKEYYTEEKESKRQRSSYILPLLIKADYLKEN